MYYQKLIFWESQVGYFFFAMVTSPLLGTGSLQEADCNLIRATRQWWRLGPAGFCRWVCWMWFVIPPMEDPLLGESRVFFVENLFLGHLKQIQIVFLGGLMVRKFPDPETNQFLGLWWDGSTVIHWVKINHLQEIDRKCSGWWILQRPER